MKRKISISLIIILVLNLVGVFSALLPTTILPLTTVSAAETVDYSLTDNFNDYADINAVKANWTLSNGGTGFTLPGTTDKKLASSSQNATRTFTPVLVRSTAGPPANAIMPGKNGKLIVEFQAYQSGGNAGDFRLQQDNTIAFAVCRRNTTSNFEIGCRALNASPSTSIYSNLTFQSGSTLNFKIEIKITDKDGNFYTNGPIVTAYANDVLTYENLTLLSSTVASINKFYFGNGSVSTSLDNLSIKLVSDNIAQPASHNVTTSIDATTAGGLASITFPTYFRATSPSNTIYDGQGITVCFTGRTDWTPKSVTANGSTVASNFYYNSTGNYYYVTIPNITADTAIVIDFRPLNIILNYDSTKGMVIDTLTDKVLPSNTPLPLTTAAMNLKIVSYGGYKVNTVNGGSSLNMSSYSHNTGSSYFDYNLTVTFSSYATAPPTVDSYNKVFQNAAKTETVSYATVHGTTAFTYGFIIWDTTKVTTADPGPVFPTTDPLSIITDGLYVFTAAKDRGSSSAQGYNLNTKQFAVGVRSLPAGSYKMKPYVAYVSAGTTTFSYGSVVSFTV